MKLFTRNKWEVRRTIWPYRDGYGVYNPSTRTMLEHGLDADHAQRICDQENERERLKKGEKWKDPLQLKMARQFNRGYFCAVAVMVRMEGYCPNTDVVELFKAGGNCKDADPEDIETFRKAKLIQ